MCEERMVDMKKIGSILVLIVCICLIILSLWNIGSTLKEYRDSRMEYDKLREEIFVIADNDTESEKESSEPASREESSGETSMQETMNEEDEEAQKLAEELARARAQAKKESESVCNAISQLRKQNEDVVGWIKFLNLDISYPVMKGSTNNEYLRHTWSGMANNSGSIFMETLNTGDFQDSHTIIYGHNMKDGSMFGKLKNYKEEGGYEKAPYFMIYTEDTAYEYQIFAYSDIAEDDEIYTIYYEPSEEFGQLVQSMKRHSWIDAGVSVDKDDKVITLSTCSTDGRRFVVNAVRTGEYQIP